MIENYDVVVYEASSLQNTSEAAGADIQRGQGIHIYLPRPGADVNHATIRNRESAGAKIPDWQIPTHSPFRTRARDSNRPGRCRLIGNDPATRRSSRAAVDLQRARAQIPHGQQDGA